MQFSIRAFGVFQHKPISVLLVVPRRQKVELKYFIITRGVLSVMIISTLKMRWSFVVCLDYKGRFAVWFLNIPTGLHSTQMSSGKSVLRVRLFQRILLKLMRHASFSELHYAYCLTLWKRHDQ